MNSVIYADFESILLFYSTCDKENERIKKINQQVPCVYSINVVNNHNKETKQTYYRGKATATEFCKEIRVISKELLNIEKKPMRPLSVKEQIAQNVDNAKCCHVCKKVFGTKKNHVKVRDHLHYAGEYKGAAHLVCNLRYSTQINMPFFS